MFPCQLFSLCLSEKNTSVYIKVTKVVLGNSLSLKSIDRCLWGFLFLVFLYATCLQKSIILFCLALTREMVCAEVPHYPLGWLKTKTGVSLPPLFNNVENFEKGLQGTNRLSEFIAPFFLKSLSVWELTSAPFQYLWLLCKCLSDFSQPWYIVEQETLMLLHHMNSYTEIYPWKANTPEI